jgi:hypothetical protein
MITIIAFLAMVLMLLVPLCLSIRENSRLRNTIQLWRETYDHNQKDFWQKLDVWEALARKLDAQRLEALAENELLRGQLELALAEDPIIVRDAPGKLHIGKRKADGKAEKPKAKRKK